MRRPISLIPWLPWQRIFLGLTLLTFLSGLAKAEEESSRPVEIANHGLDLNYMASEAGAAWIIRGVEIDGVGLADLNVAHVEVYFMTGTIAPRAKSALRDLPFRAAEKDPSVFLNPGVAQAQFPGHKVFIESREGFTLRGLHLYKLSDETRDATTVAYVYSDSVDLNINREKKLFSLTLSDAYIERQNEDGTCEIVTAAEAKPWDQFVVVELGYELVKVIGVG